MNMAHVQVSGAYCANLNSVVFQDGDAKKAARIMDKHLLHIENRIEHKSEDPQPDLATLLMSN